MTEAARTGPTRRTVLKIGVGIGVVAALPARPAPAAAAAPPAPAPVVRAVALEGTGLEVTLRPGDPATVLTHVARRFHYEVRPVTAVDGLRADPGASPRTLAHQDGTALHLDPAVSPVGVDGTLHPHELAALREVLADCDGVVAWGGDDAEPCEGHLRLAVPPDDPALVRLAERLVRRHGAPPDDCERGPRAQARAECVRAAALT